MYGAIAPCAAQAREGR